MAYAALASLAQTLENFIQQNQSRIFDDHEDKKHAFESLIANVVLLQDFLEKFPVKARKLDAQIRESADEVECLIEYFVSDMFLNFGPVNGSDIDKLLVEIERISARIESIVQEMKEMGGSSSDECGLTSNYLPLSGIRVQGNDKAVGIEDDLSKIKDNLFSDAAELVTIPIVGMGGIGKTTLARAAFDDPAVNYRFDIRRWVTVSQSQDTRETYLALLGEESLDDTTDIVDLTVKLHQLLKRRRFLIVVDDVWSSDVWDDVKRVLPNDYNRSRVLLTTRDENVASYVVSSSAIHRLELMDEGKSWILFEQKVFGEERCPPELVNIGKKIADGCRGLPIAIVVIAGILLNIRHTPDSWETIAEDVSGALNKGDESFMEIMSLSYYHLPTHLKHCFLYFGAFSEDNVIHVTNLVKLWVSEGFLKISKNKTLKDAEEIAYGCVEDLVKRNLVRISKKRYTGEIKRCKIHDLVRELCIRKAREEKFFHHVKGINLEEITNARRVGFTSETSSHIMTTYLYSIRTALCFKHDDNLVLNLHRLRLLRVLDASAIMLEKFPPQLLQLYHLRYLNLSYDGDVPFVIPKEVNKLENLETLIVQPKRSFDSSVVVVPSGILRMWKLRHLQLQGHFSLPSEMGQSFHLENLKTLSVVYNIKFEQHVVESIASVRMLDFGCFLNRDKNETWSDYFLHNFHHLSHLETLKLTLEFRCYEVEWCKQNPLLESLSFPRSLKRLTIRGCAARIPWEDMSRTIGSLPNLEELQLNFYVCSGDVWEIKEGDFQKLRDLEIVGSDLKYWRTESGSTHFPNLEILILNFCNKLIELPDCIGDIPTLRLIYLNGSHKTVAEWGSQIKEEQQDMGNDQLLILGEIDSFQGFLKEIIQPNEQLSVDQLAERLVLWAGDDENKCVQAKSVGVTHILSQLDASEDSKNQIDVFLQAFDSLMKGNEDGEKGVSVVSFQKQLQQ